MLYLLAFVLGIAPAIAMLYYIRHLDRFEPEPWSVMGRAFLAGCLSTVPALILETVLGQYGPTIGFVGTVYQAFIVAAFSEELFKGLFGYWSVKGRPEFNEVMDGLVYLGMAHMGFAVTENLVYIFVAETDVLSSVMTALMRTTTAVPLHVISGMIMGYHLGMARFASPTRREKVSHYLEAWLLPLFLHGFYDVAAFNQGLSIVGVGDLLREGFGSAALYAAVVALWLFLLPRIKKAQAASPFLPVGMTMLPAAPVRCRQCHAAYPAGANFCHMCGGAVQGHVEHAG